MGLQTIVAIADERSDAVLRFLAAALGQSLSCSDAAASIGRAIAQHLLHTDAYAPATRALCSIEITGGWAAGHDVLTVGLLQPLNRECERLDRVLPPSRDTHPNAVHGTPITPKARLKSMKGASFCVSYYAPEQLDDVIELLAADSLLLLDNGAFSAWRAGLVRDEGYWGRYWVWATSVLDRVEQSVAVIPDVIDGSAEQNMALVRDALCRVDSPAHRLMPVWHLHDELDQLVAFVEMGFGRIAFGSSGAYAQLGTPAWDARVDAAFAVIARACDDQALVHPLIHMMRGLSQIPRVRHPFATADSTNIARNHARQARRGESIAAFRSRLEANRFPSNGCRMYPHGLVNRDAPPASPAQFSLLTA